MRPFPAPRSWDVAHPGVVAATWSLGQGGSFQRRYDTAPRSLSVEATPAEASAPLVSLGAAGGIAATVAVSASVILLRHRRYRNRVGGRMVMAAAVANMNSGVPAPWQVIQNEGQTYYYNEETGETAWELPSEVLAPDLPSPWEAVGDPRYPDRVYYHNTVTGATSWERPGESPKSAAHAADQPDSLDNEASAPAAQVAEVEKVKHAGDAAPEEWTPSASKSVTPEGASSSTVASRGGRKERSAATSRKEPKPDGKTPARKSSKRQPTQLGTAVCEFLEQELFFSMEDIEVAAAASPSLRSAQAGGLRETLAFLEEELQPGVAPWAATTRRDPELLATPVAALAPALEWLEDFLWNQHWAVGFGRQALSDAVRHRPRLLYCGVKGYEDTLDWLENHGVDDQVIRSVVDTTTAVPYPLEPYPWLDIFAVGASGLETGAQWAENELGMTREDVSAELRRDPSFVLTAATAAGSSNGPAVAGFPLPSPRESFLSEQANRWAKDLESVAA